MKYPGPQANTINLQKVKESVIELLNKADKATDDAEYNKYKNEILSKLNNAIWGAGDINDYYFKEGVAFQKRKAEFTANNLDTFFKHIPYWIQICEMVAPDENWETAPTITVNNIKLVISNYGRLKSNNIFIQQTEDSAHKNVGWLIPKHDDIKQYSVYELVAQAYLSGECKNTFRGHKTVFDVHHISNDGYDNRPCNLIYLPREIHSEIQHQKKSFI